MEGLPDSLKERVLSNLNPRDMARTAEVSRGLREASHAEFHNLLNNEHLTRLAERYKSKLQAPHIQTEAFADLAPDRRRPLRQEVNRLVANDSYRFQTPRSVMEGLRDGHWLSLTDQLGRPIDRGR